MGQCHKLILEAYCQPVGVEVAKALVGGSGDIKPPPPSGAPDWCICGKCHDMEASSENVCCRKRPCITTTDSFSTLVLQMGVLSVAIVHSADHYVRDVDYSPASYQKAAYRQWTLWQCGHLGRSNRRVVPSCVVLAIRNKYPAPDGVYMGYRDN